MTANQRYRKYVDEGGQLSFAEYMTREKKKGFINFDGKVDIPVNKPLSDSITKVLNQIHMDAGYQDRLTNKYIFGINKNLLIGVGVVAVVVTAIVIYKKTKK